MTKTLEERKKIALHLRHKGYNCAQCVILAFEDVTGLDNEIATKITSGLGSGVGATRELCGVINAMALTQGMLQSSDPAAKGISSKVAGNLARQFASLNKDRMRCADLKGKEGIRPCEELILQGVEILHNHFQNHDKE